MWYYILVTTIRGHSSPVEYQLPKLRKRVRFPLSAPLKGIAGIEPVRASPSVKQPCRFPLSAPLIYRLWDCHPAQKTCARSSGDRVVHSECKGRGFDSHRAHHTKHFEYIENSMLSRCFSFCGFVF